MNILSLILEDKRSQREGWLAQGFWALLVFRLSAGRTRVRSRILRFLWGIPNLLLLKSVEIVTGITLPETTRLGRRLCIEHPGGIVIHGNSVIGDDCRIRQGVTLGAKTHLRPLDAPALGNRVDVGAGAKILGAIQIGDDVVIGANAVVIRDVPSGAVAVGIPARILGEKDGFLYRTCDIVVD